MQRPQLTKRAESRALVARPLFTTVLVALLSLALMMAGCSCGDEEIQTDPTLGMDLPTQDDIPVETVPERGFEGSGTEQDDLGASDIVDPVPSVVLQDVFFDFDQYDIKPESRAVLNANGERLRNNPGTLVLIEGHCDERGTIQYNLALGEKRAKGVRDYLVSLGVSPTRLEVVSYGKERPFVIGHDESAWSQNRRAHFVVK